MRTLVLCAVAAGCSSSDTPGPVDTGTASDASTTSDTGTAGDASTAGDACVRPEIDTTNLGERCDGDQAVTCPTGQSCRYKVSPAVPPPPKYCLISCTDDCACPAGYDCLPSTSGGPVPYCVAQQ
jgi:hypothetical protein